MALIDHGFAFSRPHDVINATILLDWRRRAGLQPLAAVEVDAVERLLKDGQLLGLAQIAHDDHPLTDDDAVVHIDTHLVG